MSNAREKTLKAVISCLKEKTLMQIDAHEEDAGFIKMLSQSLFRHWVELESILKQYIKKPLPAKEQTTQIILQLGAAELRYMQTPAYAAISEWVELSKKYANKYQSGLVNAVLRKVSNHPTNQTEEQHFFPTSFLKILKQDYSKEQIESMENAAQKSEPPLNITVKDNPQDWAEKLGGRIITGNSLVLTSKGAVNALEGYKEGAWWVQDFAASLAVTIMGDIKGKRILDLCAAPGGKTAQLIAKGANVTALDISPARLETLKNNLERLNLKAQDIICSDAISYLQNYQGEGYDGILLDAPCSATGIFRRHPEILQHKDISDIKKQSEIQRKILQEVGKALKIGGFLVYSVCSLAKAEGKSQIRHFLEKDDSFTLIKLKESDLTSQQNTALTSLITEEGYLATLADKLPEIGGVDSFFIAKLQKAKEK